MSLFNNINNKKAQQSSNFLAFSMHNAANDNKDTKNIELFGNSNTNSVSFLSNPIQKVAAGNTTEKSIQFTEQKQTDWNEYLADDNLGSFYGDVGLSFGSSAKAGASSSSSTAGSIEENLQRSYGSFSNYDTSDDVRRVIVNGGGVIRDLDNNNDIYVASDGTVTTQSKNQSNTVSDSGISGFLRNNASVSNKEITSSSSKIESDATPQSFSKLADETNKSTASASSSSQNVTENEAELQELEAQYDEACEQGTAYAEQAGQYRQQAEKFSAEVEKQDGIIEEQENIIDEQNTIADEQGKIADEQTALANDLGDQISSLDNQISELESSNTDGKNDDRISELKNKKAQLQKQKAEAENKAKEATDKRQNAIEKKSKAEEAKNNATTAKSEAEKSLASATASKDEAIENMEKMHDKQSELSAKIDDCKRKTDK